MGFVVPSRLAVSRSPHCVINTSTHQEILCQLIGRSALWAGLQRWGRHQAANPDAESSSAGSFWAKAGSARRTWSSASNPAWKTHGAECRRPPAASAPPLKLHSLRFYSRPPWSPCHRRRSRHPPPRRWWLRRPEETETRWALTGLSRRQQIQSDTFIY